MARLSSRSFHFPPLSSEPRLWDRNEVPISSFPRGGLSLSKPLFPVGSYPHFLPLHPHPPHTVMDVSLPLFSRGGFLLSLRVGLVFSHRSWPSTNIETCPPSWVFLVFQQSSCSFFSLFVLFGRHGRPEAFRVPFRSTLSSFVIVFL